VDNKITIVSSVLEDVFELAPNLRQDDIQEVNALGLVPEQSLLRGFVFSKECFSAKRQGKTIGMFGVSEYGMPKGFGSIWFLGSDECTKIPVTFVKEGIRYTQELMQKYDILINAVDSRNTSHIEWIQRIGMSLSNPIMINGYEFLQFYKVKGVK
jgi:hypothetical protein